ncbi:TlpA family protein disulfide reductase [Tumebacillus permanentifrigoris]|uniref:Peroxiredoxin n=1 Tax=Tumebacillus permanentifrigoris TaxID=378543 RepID=A0A316DAE9_9BACL|nr:TlpA disulfide reductase family protein [Tumebacillus permanentifrigoris]PWK14475.1 peroxiredoxin [Tumebacillus permanentifrigoris]
MNRIPRITRLVGVIALALGTVGCGPSATQGTLIQTDGVARATTAVPGMVSPNFSLLDYEGKRHQVGDYLGKPVLLNFWASWCGPCRQELPDLAQASHDFADSVQIVGVNLAEQDAPDVSRELLKRYKVAYPNLLDTEGSVASAYGIMVIPTTFLLDRKGKVVEKIQGPLTRDRIETLLKKVQ